MDEPTTKAPKLGFFKSLRKLPKIIHNPATSLKEVLDQHDGLVQVQMPMGLLFLTDRPDFIRHVLQKNHKNYTKTANLRKTVRQQIGNGLLTSEGAYWLKQRRAIQPGFHKKRLGDISKTMVSEINHFMDTVLDKYAETGEEFDLASAMTNLTFKIVSKGLFGTAVSEDKLEAMDEIVSEGQQFIVNQIRKPFLKPWYFISGANRRNRQLKEKGDQLILEIIQDRQKSTEKHNDLLDMLLETRYEDGSKMTDQQLLDEAIIMYVAGHETSAVALSWTWYLIANHPEVEKKLLQSVQEGIGDQDPGFELLRNLGYTLQVVEEGMRLYPPAWIVDREPLEEDSFEGIPIRKKQDIACHIYSLHRNQKYWPDPDKFDPERFSPENKKDRIPFSYIPFGGGPRLCVGNNFALMEMQYVLAMMIKRYSFEVMPNQVIDTNPLVTLRPRYGIKIRLKKRDSKN